MIEINSAVDFQLIENFVIIPVLIYQGEYFIYANKAAVDLTGYTKEELMKMKFYQIVHPDYQKMVKERGLKRQQGVKIESEYRFKILTKSRDEKWIYFKALPIKFNGKMAVVISGLDITDQILNENRLNESRTKYKNLFKKYQEILKLILKIDLSAKIDIKTFLSQILHWGFKLIDEAEAGACFIYKNNSVNFVDAIGHNIDILKEINVPMNAFTNINKGVQLLKKIDKKTVKRIPDKESKKKFLNAIKPSYEALTFDLYLKNKKYCGIAFDITDKEKHFSEESIKILSVFYKLATTLFSIKCITEELKNEKLYLEAILDSIGEGIIVTDEHLKIKNMNKPAKKITGFKLREIYNKDIFLVFTLFDLDTIEPIKITRKNIKNIIFQEKKKALLLDKASKEKPILFKVNSITSKKNLFKEDNVSYTSGYIFVFEDISKMYKLEEQLKQFQINETVGKLAGGIAHDFNNILGGILGAAEVIKSKLSDNDELIEFIDIIINSSITAKETTSKLLTLTRKTSHNLKIRDVHNIIRKSLDIAEKSLNKGIEINFIPQAKETSILCFEPDLQNAFLNLYINAFDAMPEGGELTIKTENLLLTDLFDLKIRKYKNFSLSNTNYIRILIKDTGAGISQKIIDKIFEPYFTTKESGKGTGLGLASVLSVIESLQGAITVESEVGVGTQFEILLPIAFIENKTFPSNDTELVKRRKSIESNFKGMAVVIDDEQNIRKTTTKLLQLLGFETKDFSDGVDAIKFIKKHFDKIKIILLDLVMPKIGGKETLKEIRKITGKIPVIIVSGYIKNENIDELLSIKNTYFLTKPFSKKELLNVIINVFT